MIEKPDLKVFILIPVHNRKVVTLRCLETLKTNGDLETYHVVVIDDGSTDGTCNAIQESFRNVHLLFGDGNLWWTGAIEKGMRYAYDQGADYFIWLNDDTLPERKSIAKLVEYCSLEERRIVSGQCFEDSCFNQPTYGGILRQRFTTKLISQPLGTTYPCDCMSGNFVCLPRSVISSIGYPPSNYLPHAYADIYYTWKAKSVGYNLFVVTQAKAISPLNPIYEGWLTDKVSLWSIWRKIHSPKSNLYPPAMLFFNWKFYGIFGIFIFIFTFIKLVMISIGKLIFGRETMYFLKQKKDSWFKSFESS